MSTAIIKNMTDDQIARFENTATEIEQAVEQFGLAQVVQKPAVQQAFALAKGIGTLRELLSAQQVEFLFAPLMGTSLGFLSDKDYPPNVVRDVVIEALLRGFKPVGNEFNIIGGKFYAAKAGLERLVREFPGVTALEHTPGKAEKAGGIEKVDWTSTWLFHGEPMVLDCRKTSTGDNRIQVRANAGMGIDAILGKAERKALHRILKRLHGADVAGPDGEIDVDVSGAVRAMPEPEGNPFEDSNDH